MCGIAGFARINATNFSFDQAVLKSINNALAHRGPDGEGAWTSVEDQIAFIHRRLSILDVSINAAQPMHDEEQTVVIIYNGEIYNYRALNKELEQLGYRFKTTSDTETLIYAYKAWGISFLDRLDGMFAIALFDRVTKKLFLIRDRIGIKPLYFSLQSGYLSFASELKALWQMPWIEKKVNPGMLSYYFSYLATPAPHTLYQQIYKLPPGHYICLDEQRTVAVTRWYDLLAGVKSVAIDGERPLVDELTVLITAAVEKRCISDVPVGVYLSGGLDSSIVAALMARTQKKLKTFTVTFSDGPEFIESDWARKVAHLVGAEHYELFITEHEAYRSFEQMIYHQDEPLADSVCLPLLAVSYFAKMHDVTVVQIGEGADELFGGYPVYHQYLAWYQTWERTQQLLPLSLRKGLYYAARPFVDPYTLKRGLLEQWMRGNHFFNSSVYLFSEDAKREMLTVDEPTADDTITSLFGDSVAVGAAQWIDQYYDAWFARGLRPDPLAMIAYFELMYRLPELLLARTDKMTMAAGIEARVPFLDYRLVEYALGLPYTVKLRDGIGKYILKKGAERLLPREVIYRKKVGFAAPIVRWFAKGNYFKQSLQDQLLSKGAWKDTLRAQPIEEMLKRHANGQGNYAYHLWAVYNLLPFLS